MDNQLNRPSVKVKDVEAIISLDDQPILRNLKITQCYHDLSQAIATLIGHENVNWCTFATWASKTAGRFIRGDEIPKLMRQALDESPQYVKGLDTLNNKLIVVHPEASLSHSSILEFMDTIIEQGSGYIATGNLKVFAELGPLFAAMVETFAADTTYDEAKLNEFLKPLKPGATESDGQDPIRSAVTHFYQARFETDPNQKAERILMANALTGLHEQTRLQSYIYGAMNVPVADTLGTLCHEELAKKIPGAAWVRHKILSILEAFWRPMAKALNQLWLWMTRRFWHKEQTNITSIENLLRREVHSILDQFLHLIADEVSQKWLEIATRFMMELKLPDGTIRLGSDLPSLPGQPIFPPPLQKIDEAELRQLLELYRADGNTAGGSGAVNWANLPERMRFILELFRSRQLDASLFEQPFTEDQRQTIAEGRVPEPNGDM